MSFVVVFGRKRDCKNMNNRGMASEDRISELPEALILEILSRLPTKVAVATSVLSKQWQSRWKFLPTLTFDSCDQSHHELGTFSKNVCKSLLSHKALVLQSLHLRISSQRCNEMDNGILIGIAFARNVRKLALHVEPGKGFIYPKSLYNCETLETLELNRSILMDVPSSVSLKSLRTLHLHYVDFEDDESFLNLLAGCPNLEKLVVHGNLYDNGKTITIDVPSVQRLTLFKGSDEPRTSWVINAPSLKYLTIGGVDDIDSCLIENLPDLVEANIIDISAGIINEKLMGSLTSVKRLSLSLPPFKNKFPLVYLELLTYQEWWNQIMPMLDSSPKLQVLKLIDHPDCRNDLLPCEKWNQPKNVPQCLQFHLETFMWEDYEWKQEDEIEVAKYPK